MPPPTARDLCATTLCRLIATTLALGLAACGGADNDGSFATAAAPLAHKQAQTEAPPGCTPTAPATRTLSPDKDHDTLCWGNVGWNEPTLDGAALQQNLDFYPATGSASATTAPLIVWAHPNGRTKALDATLRDTLLKPALLGGYAFASLEFRHPVVNAPTQPNSPVPHTDIAQALNYLVAHASALQVDPRNIFLVGQSRGTLGVWTALQPHLTSPRVRAVFGVNAQTSYDGNDFAQWFLVEPARDDFLRAFNRKNPNADRYGSAVRDVTRNAPAVHLRYDSPVVGRQLTLAEMQQQDALHYPDFGPALCKAYTQAQAKACSYDADSRYHDRPDLAYEGYVRFFDRHRAP
ncbi:alpha/beta hydrolase [Acidovorax radicis]|uniref:alpha/beta hydrolase n=1 Tax=Acidovorax radicis TaxID=758826 RepID=UPI00023785D2|nr:hypothetical protein [Acidovorax radicis]